MRWIAIGVGGVVGTLLAMIAVTWASQYADRFMLPNGFVVKREYVFPFDDRDDLYAADGRTRLVRDIDFLCFDDRFVFASSKQRGKGGGLFDARTQGRASADARASVRQEHGLKAGRRGCNGYFFPMMGADFFYPGAEFPPSCSARNFDNPTLRNEEWLKMQCDDRFPDPPNWPK